MKYSLKASALLITGFFVMMLSACGSSQQTASTPYWAPVYSDAASVPYYYFPDYGMYYDARSGQYYYQNNGAWVSSATVPYGVDLDNSYVVMLDRNSREPWENHAYYQRNYPAWAEQHYDQIARDQRLITNVPYGHTVVPRAYNENDGHVIFEEREHARDQAGNRPAWARVGTREVPMSQIAPNMPREAREYKYGGAERGR